MGKKKVKTGNKKNIWLWGLSVFFILAALSFLPSFASVLFGILTLLLLPAKKWQDFIMKRIPEKIAKLKVVWIVLLAVVAIAISPTQDTSKEDGDTSTLQSTYEEAVGAESDDSTEQSETLVVSDEDKVVEDETVAVIPSVTPAVTPDPTSAPTPTPTPSPTPTEEPSSEVTEDSYFEVHFIDVGQADAALVLCDGQYLLIDGGNAEDSSLMYSYLKKIEATYLDYVVATHAHEDHVGGLSGALNYATVGTVYCPVTDYDTKVFSDFKKYVEKAGATITVPTAGETFQVGSASVEIVGVNGGSDVNDTSIVLHIIYGETAFLFTGDAERAAEQAILNAGYDIGSTVLKVGHHGSKDSTTYPFLREIMPTYAIISVGNDNAYSHPTEEALSRLRDAEVKVYRTDLQGDIVAISDGHNVTIQVEKNADADTLAPPATPTPKPVVVEKQPTVQEEIGESSDSEEGGAYAVNGNNGKIHMVGECPATGTGKSAMKNPVYFNTYEDAERHSISIAPNEEKRKCGNCW